MAAAEAAAASTTTSRRFAAACGALGQYVKSAELARPAAVPVRPLPLMPGADVPDDQEQREAVGPAPAQLAIFYGGRVLVALDGVPADKAANLLRIAASAARGGATVEPQPSGGRIAAAADLLPVARKASLQLFMEKRRCRVAAARTAPYRRPDGSDGDACREDQLKLAL